MAKTRRLSTNVPVPVPSLGQYFLCIFTSSSFSYSADFSPDRTRPVDEIEMALESFDLDRLCRHFEAKCEEFVVFHNFYSVGLHTWYASGVDSDYIRPLSDLSIKCSQFDREANFTLSISKKDFMFAVSADVANLPIVGLNLKIRVKKEQSEVEMKMSKQDDQIWTCRPFSPKEMSDLYVENRLVFGITVAVSFCCCKLASDLPSKMLPDPKICAEFSDFTLVSKEGESVHASKLILATNSPVFQAMLATDCREKREGKVFMKDYSTCLLRGFWLSILEKTITIPQPKPVDLEEWEYCTNLLEMFDKYDMEQLKTCAELYLMNQLTVGNVIKVAKISHQCSAQKLTQSCLDFIRAHKKNRLLSTEALFKGELPDKLKINLLEVA